MLDRTEPEVWKTPISPATADIMTDLMVSVAENGTASCCIALEGGVPVAAKTGTAQLNGPGEPERSHAWIVAFAPADAPRYAVAVTILGHQRGDLGQHGRPPRRPGRQDRARRRPRRRPRGWPMSTMRASERQRASVSHGLRGRGTQWP